MPIEQAIGLSLGTASFRNFGETEQRETTIVGVVDDLKQDAPDGPPQPELFIAYAQVRATYSSQAFVVLRTVDDPAAHIETLRTALREEDPTLALDAVMTMDQRIGRSAARPRTYAVLLGGFAVFALVIAGAGLFGVLSYSRDAALARAGGANRARRQPRARCRRGAQTDQRRDDRGAADRYRLATALSNNLAPFHLRRVGHTTGSVSASRRSCLLIVGVIACVVPARAEWRGRIRSRFYGRRYEPRSVAAFGTGTRELRDGL